MTLILHTLSSEACSTDTRQQLAQVDGGMQNDNQWTVAQREAIRVGIESMECQQARGCLWTGKALGSYRLTPGIHPLLLLPLFKATLATQAHG